MQVWEWECLICVAVCSELSTSANVRCQMEVITDPRKALQAAKLRFHQCLHQAAFCLWAKIILHSLTAALFFALHYQQLVRQSDPEPDCYNTWAASVRSLCLTRKMSNERQMQCRTEARLSFHTISPDTFKCFCSEGRTQQTVILCLVHVHMWIAWKCLKIQLTHFWQYLCSQENVSREHASQLGDGNISFYLPLCLHCYV